MSYLITNYNKGNLEISSGSVVKEVYRSTELSFKDVFAQLAKGELLVLGGEQYDLKANTIGATLALNKWWSDEEAIRQSILSNFTYITTKVPDQLRSMLSGA